MPSISPSDYDNMTAQDVDEILIMLNETMREKKRRQEEADRKAKR